MPAKVFLSCGQATDDERSAALKIKETLTKSGFDVFGAVQAQPIQAGRLSTASTRSNTTASSFATVVLLVEQHLHMFQ